MEKATIPTLTYKGVTKTLGEWARDLGMSPIVLHTAMQKGMSDEQVISLLKASAKADDNAYSAEKIDPDNNFKLPPDKIPYENYSVFDVTQRQWLTGRRAAGHRS